ncbi:MAG TPA: hypothetical protein VLR69_09860, partial [Thermoanaerobaculia bacterium]|nr:hypothetical protein [Thermoanaerobaculia bacterium]
VRTWKGRPVQGKFRQITIRVDAKRFKMWLAASAAVEYRDLRHWLMYLADREAEASITPS